MKKLLYITIFLITSVCSFAQSAGRALSNGNEVYDNKHYTHAESSYRIANSRDSKSVADYNLGNALYKQKLTSEAETAFKRAISKATTKQAKHEAYHNLGNTYMKAKNYKAAEQAYKNALLNNPKDDQTRYNYAVAKKMNEENQDNNQDNQDQNQDNQDQNQDNQDQNKDNQDQNKDQENQDKGDQDQQDKDKGDQDQNDKGNQDDQNKDKNEEGDQEKEQPQQNNPNAPSPDQIERILDAMNKDEKDVHQRLIDRGPKGEKKEKGQPAEQRKKDW